LNKTALAWPYFREGFPSSGRSGEKSKFPIPYSLLSLYAEKSGFLSIVSLPLSILPA